MNNPTAFNTQKIKLDLMKELSQAEEQAKQTRDVKTLSDLAHKMRWLTNKINFLDSPEYQRRKAAQ